MVEFLKQHKLYLTPLSPIHMGAGEDFELTNYVIQNKLLYNFDISNVYLIDKQRSELLKLVKNIKSENDIQSIQLFFKKNIDSFVAGANHTCYVTPELDEEYQTKLGKVSHKETSGKNHFNQFWIERASYHPVTNCAYIPGSSFKGMLRTAWLSHLSLSIKGEKFTGKEKQKDYLEKYEEVLLGKLTSDPMRLFKIADFTSQQDIYTEILYSTNHEKRNPKRDSGPFQYRETIIAGQYRALTSTLTKMDLVYQADAVKKIDEPLPSQKLLDVTLKDLIKYVNNYNIPRFEAEYDLLNNRKLVSSEWLDSTRKLLQSLKTEMDQGNIILVRLGKNTGAESKTDNKFARINISQIKKILDHSTSIWLASEGKKFKTGMLPFGWALVEVDPIENNQFIKDWCSQFEKKISMIRKYKDDWRHVQKDTLEEQKIFKEKEEEQAKREQDAKLAQEVQKKLAAEALANMSDAERLVHDVLEIVAQPNLQPSNEAGQKALADVIAKLNEGLNMSEQDQRIIGQQLPFAKLKDIVSKKKEKEVKPLLAKLRGEG